MTILLEELFSKITDLFVGTSSDAQNTPKWENVILVWTAISLMLTNTVNHVELPVLLPGTPNINTDLQANNVKHKLNSQDVKNVPLNTNVPIVLMDITWHLL